MRLFDRMRLSHCLYPSFGKGASMNGLIIVETLAGCPMRTIKSLRSFRSRNIRSNALSTATFVCDVMRTVSPASTACIAAAAIVVVLPVPGGPSTAMYSHSGIEDISSTIVCFSWSRS